MIRLLSHTHLVFIGLLLLGAGGAFAYEAIYIWPIKTCETHGGWWDAKDRRCGVPMPIWRITGHGGPGDKPAVKKP